MACLQFCCGKPDPVMGTALTVTLPQPAAKDSTITVKIQYNTTPECKALGWLTAECVYRPLSSSSH